MIPWGGAAQAPYDYKMVGVVPWVKDGQVIEDWEQIKLN